jgi:hypothetical protein
MGFGLKRTFQKAVDPMTYIKGLSGGLIGKDQVYGADGPPNPFGIPNLDFLKDTNKFDYLRKPVKGGEAAFQDYLGAIDAPSSVDAVRSDVEGERLQSLLKGIDEDTARAAANVKLDAEERGLGGPGMASDIEFSGLGTAESGGVKAKTDARLAAMMAELDRVKAKEDARRGAYETRYNTNTTTQNARDLALAQLTSGRDEQLAQLLAQLYSGGEKNKIEGRKPGLLDKLNLGFNIG